MPDPDSYRIQVPDGTPVLVIYDPDRRTLVELKMVNGKMVAAYDPVDLDEAAAAWWDIVAAHPAASRFVVGESGSGGD